MAATYGRSGQSRKVWTYLLGSSWKINVQEGTILNSSSNISTPAIVGVVHNGSALTTYLNGQTVGAFSGLVNVGTNSAPVIFGNTFKGYIGDTFYYQRSLSASEAQTMTEFYGNKYGISLPLAPLAISPKGGTYQTNIRAGHALTLMV